MRRKIHQVTFYTYPKFLFVWPLMVLGFVLYPLTERANPEVLAWVWLLTLVVVLVTVGFDVSRNYAAFWLVLVGGLWFMIVWLQDVKGFTVFRRIYHFMLDLNPQYSPALGLVVSIMLTVFFAIMWVWTRLNSKWRITHNEFEHFQFGRMDDSLARGAKRVRSSYPDFFEFALCLAGDLVIFDAEGRHELRRIPHVPLLPLLKRRINLLLEATAVTAEQTEDEQSDYNNDDRGG